jgi:hypothetical protein
MPMVEISNGELIDKYTILLIKRSEIKDPIAAKNVSTEFFAISPMIDKLLSGFDGAFKLQMDLFGVNKDLWGVEDRLRELERHGDFGDTFIALARSVYKLNDLRARIKKEINELTGSNIVEEKSYEQY